jgi:hypothetical protein
VNLKSAVSGGLLFVYSFWVARALWDADSIYLKDMLSVCIVSSKQTKWGCFLIGRGGEKEKKKRVAVRVA